MSLTSSWLEQMVRDLRYALRSVRKSPVIATVVVISLALGIGANTAIFSLIDAVMLRLLPLHNPQELVLLERTWVGSRPHGGFTNPLWESFRDQQDVFSGVFAWGNDLFDLGHGGPVHYVDGIYVSGDYFSTLGIQPTAGRLLNETDDRPGCPATVVMSYDFWQSHFNGIQSAVGSSISLGHRPYQVVGVSARGFYGVEVGKKFDVAVPICTSTREALEQRAWWWLNIMGRPKPGISAQQLQARLAVLSPSVVKPALPQDWDAKSQENFLKAQLLTVPAGTGTSELRDHFAGPLNIVMAIVGLVLLICCANIASLMMARSTVRRRELGIRTALGASRARLVRQLLTESVLLSSAGALAGLFIAQWGSKLLVHEISTGRNTVALDLSLDARVLAFTALAAISTGVFVGLLPALRSTRSSLIWAMKGCQGYEQQRGRFLAGKAMVGLQIALSLVLLIGGGLLVRSFLNLLNVDLGFDRAHVLIVSTDLDTAKVAEDKQPAVYEEITRRLQTLPGVLSVSRSFATPLSGIRLLTWVRPQSAAEGGREFIHFNFIAPDYLRTLRTPLLEGRDFDANDRSTSPQVAILNEVAARRLFGGADPLGKQFYLDFPPSRQHVPIEVIGLAGDAKYDSARAETPPTAYFPVAQMHEHDRNLRFELRTANQPDHLKRAVQQAVAGVNKEIPLQFTTLSDQVNDSELQERMLAKLSGFFAALALLLAMVGLYGALSYFVTERQAEFGIRLALGAQRSSILRLVFTDVVQVLVAGLSAGLAISLVLVNLLEKMLFGVEPRDTSTMAAAVCAMAITALLAGYLPARRATRVDPQVALRNE